MRILYLSSASIPSKTANSIHIMKMCESFAKLGHDVTLFAKIEDHNKGLSDIFKYYDVEEIFSIHKLPGFKAAIVNRLNGLYMAIKAKQLKPDFIIGRDITACFFSAIYGLNLYFETHGPMEESGRLSNLLFKRILKRKQLQKFIVITKSLAEYFKNHYTNLEGRVLVLPDGADKVNYADITPVHIRKPGKINIGFTGHLYPGKGMEVISKLIPLSNYAHFHIVGGREQDIAQWKSLITADNVTFYGFVPHTEVKNYIFEQDILLLPNQEKVGSNAGRDIGRWTSPLKLFEYMAMAKPIICSNLEVLKEIVHDGENAILCDPINEHEWINAINRLNDDRHLSIKIGETARIDLEQNYTWLSRAKKIVDDFLLADK